MQWNIGIIDLATISHKAAEIRRISYSVKTLLVTELNNAYTCTYHLNVERTFANEIAYESLLSILFHERARAE